MIVSRPWRIVLLNVAYYATSSARNFAKLCQIMLQIMLAQLQRRKAAPIEPASLRLI